MAEKNFHDQLKEYIHEYIMLTYVSAKKYPKDEQYGLISQDRRAAVSIMLNYIEGYAGGTWNMTAHQYEIGLASLKESIPTSYLGTGRGIGLIPRGLRRKGGSRACSGVQTFDYMHDI